MRWRDFFKELDISELMKKDAKGFYRHLKHIKDIGLRNVKQLKKDFRQLCKHQKIAPITPLNKILRNKQNSIDEYDNKSIGNLGKKNLKFTEKWIDPSTNTVMMMNKYVSTDRIMKSISIQANSVNAALSRSRSIQDILAEITTPGILERRDRQARFIPTDISSEEEPVREKRAKDIDTAKKEAIEISNDFAAETVKNKIHLPIVLISPEREPGEFNPIFEDLFSTPKKTSTLEAIRLLAEQNSDNKTDQVELESLVSSIDTINLIVMKSPQYSILEKNKVATEITNALVELLIEECSKIRIVRKHFIPSPLKGNEKTLVIDYLELLYSAINIDGKQQKQIHTHLNCPIGPSTLIRLNYSSPIQEFPTKLSQEIFKYSPVLPLDLYVKLEESLSETLYTELCLDNNSTNEMNILHKLIFDSLNESLDYRRLYGLDGCPANIVSDSRIPPQITPSNCATILEGARNDVIDWMDYRAGILPEKEPGLVEAVGLDALELLREEATLRIVDEFVSLPLTPRFRIMRINGGLLMMKFLRLN